MPHFLLLIFAFFSLCFALSPAVASAQLLPCILNNGCQCDHSLQYNNSRDHQTYGTCIHCNPPFGGPTCSDRLVTCLNFGEHAANSSSGNDFSCHCPPQWQGSKCEHKQCINSVGGAGPWAVVPADPRTNACDDCQPGFTGLACDMCTNDEACQWLPLGAGPEAAPPPAPAPGVTPRRCNTSLVTVGTDKIFSCVLPPTSPFLRLLGPRRNISATARMQCSKPGGAAWADPTPNGTCSLTFFRTEEHASWIDPFFSCSMFNCSMDLQSAGSSGTGSGSSADSRAFQENTAIRDGRVVGATILLLQVVGVAGLGLLRRRGTRERWFLRLSRTLTATLLVFVFVMVILMSRAPSDAGGFFAGGSGGSSGSGSSGATSVTYQCRQTNCSCSANPPNPSWTPFCLESSFLTHLFGSLNEGARLACPNTNSPACVFTHDQLMGMAIALDCAASECTSRAPPPPVAAPAPEASSRAATVALLLTAAALVAGAIVGLRRLSMRRAEHAAAEFRARFMRQTSSNDGEGTGTPEERGSGNGGVPRRSASNSLPSSSILRRRPFQGRNGRTNNEHEMCTTPKGGHVDGRGRAAQPAGGGGRADSASVDVSEAESTSSVAGLRARAPTTASHQQLRASSGGGARGGAALRLWGSRPRAATPSPCAGSSDVEGPTDASDTERGDGRSGSANTDTPADGNRFHDASDDYGDTRGSDADVDSETGDGGEGGQGGRLSVCLSAERLSYTVPGFAEGQPERLLLDNVCVEARSGELVALIGPSGAGKTTLLDLLAARAKMGTVWGRMSVDGAAAVNAPPYRSARDSTPPRGGGGGGGAATAHETRPMATAGEDSDDGEPHQHGSARDRHHHDFASAGNSVSAAMTAARAACASVLTSASVAVAVSHDEPGGAAPTARAVRDRLDLYRSVVGYVAQEDTLIPALTVRETVRFAAELKLPAALTKTELDEVTDDVLAALRLTHCANTLVGDAEGRRGVSGGERRRVSIATELVACPRVLFLDEPTSGLDSCSARHVMEAVAALAHRRKRRRQQYLQQQQQQQQQEQQAQRRTDAVSAAVAAGRDLGLMPPHPLGIPSALAADTARNSEHVSAAASHRPTASYEAFSFFEDGATNRTEGSDVTPRSMDEGFAITPPPSPTPTAIAVRRSGGGSSALDSAFFAHQPIVVCSIHQPSEDIFRLFDKVVLISSGRVLYSGPATSAVACLCAATSSSPRLPLPERVRLSTGEAHHHHQQHRGSGNGRVAGGSHQAVGGAVSRQHAAIGNQCEWLLAAENVLTTQEKDSLAAVAREQQRLQWRLRQHEAATRTRRAAQTRGSAASNDASDGDDDRRQLNEQHREPHTLPPHRGSRSGEDVLAVAAASRRFYLNGWQQLSVLSRRTFASLMGSYYLIVCHAVVVVAIGGLLSLLYRAQSLDLDGALNRAGSLTFLLLILAFMSLSCLELFLAERRLFAVERGMFYSPGPYYTAKVFFDFVPLRLAPALVIGAMIYFPMSLRTDGGEYFLWFLLLLASFTLCITAMTLCIGMVAPSFGSAALLSAVVILWHFVFGGMMIESDTIPAAFRPFHLSSPFFLAFEALMVNELNGQQCTFAPADSAGIKINNQIPLLCVQYLYNMGLRPENFARDVALLWMWLVAFLVLGWVLLTYVVRVAR